MAEIYLNTNTTTRKTYDQDGNFFNEYNPVFPYKSSFRLFWQLYVSTPDADSADADLSTWEKADYTGCGALVTCDDDFKHRVIGTLATAITSGSTISSVTVGIGGNRDLIPTSGFLTLFNENGGTTDLLYESITFSGTTAVCNIGEWEADANYTSGSVAKISQEPYFQSYYNASLSDPAHGLFVFDCTSYSRKLSNKADTASGQWIDVQGIELLPFKIDENNHYIEYPSFLCDTAKISVNMGEAGTNPVVTQPVENMVSAFISTIIAQGFSIQFSVDGSSDWHTTQTSSDRYFRLRSTAAGGDWSTAIALAVGPQGIPGTTPSIGENGHWYIGSTDTGLVADGAYLEPRVDALENAVGDVETAANAIIGEPEQ